MQLASAVLFMVAIAVMSAPAGCGADNGSATGAASPGDETVPSAPGAFVLSSPAFTHRGDIPRDYACEDKGGRDVSPPLSWSNPPAGTAAYAVIMDDETPPCGKGGGACMHWSVFNLPADRTGLAEGEDLGAEAGIAMGRNYTGGNGYAGPCPPGPHVYKITVYALGPGAPMVKSGEAQNRSTFAAYFAGYILDSDTIEGTLTP